MRNLPRLVHMRAELRDDLCLVQGRGKLEIPRSGVDGVGIQNHQPIHLARIQVRNQRLQVTDLIARHRACRIA